MRKRIRNFLKGLSLTTAMFIFQACYGTGPASLDYVVQFRIVSSETGDPLEGIMVNYYDGQVSLPQGETDAEGQLTVCLNRFLDHTDDPFTFRIHDPKVVYSSKDTTFTTAPSQVEIRLQKFQ